MTKKQFKAIAAKVKELGEEVRTQLGCGFNETIYQNALAIEFRNLGIEYLKEVNIEIFYKGESVGVDRPDFVITRIDDCKDPILLELKAVDNLTDNHRAQLKSYCTSLPRNTNPVLKDFAGGILMAFPATDSGKCSGVTVFAVSPDFEVLVDDQQEEKVRKEQEKAREKDEKEARKRKAKEKEKQEKKRKKAKG